MPIEVIFLMFLSIFGGYIIGRWETDRAKAAAGRAFLENDQIASFAVAQYNRVIEVAKNNTLTLAKKWCPKKHLAELEDVSNDAFKEFTKKDFIHNMEKTLKVKLVESGRNHSIIEE